MQHHRRKLGDQAFLMYPTCPAGHYFMIPGDARIREKKFNPEQTGRELIKEINLMRALHPEFSANYHPLAHVNITDTHDAGEGIMDTSLRGRLELTKELLARVGYAVPED